MGRRCRSIWCTSLTIFQVLSHILWTINDFSVYDNLSGYNVKRHKACHVCEEETFSIQLKYERKIVYLGTLKFLPMFHHYRRLQKEFNGFIKEGKSPKAVSGGQVYQRVKNLMNTYRKVKQTIVEKNV